MSNRYEEVWKFETKNFRISLDIAPETDDPRDHFEFPEDIAAVTNGDVMWFMARATVSCLGHIISQDYLGSCAYKNIKDFIASHRDEDPMNRNSSIMRQVRGNNVSIGHYFPDMIRTAVNDARQSHHNLSQIKLRA